MAKSARSATGASAAHKNAPLDRFKNVRLASEDLNASSNSQRGDRPVLVQKIRLLAHDPDVHPSIEIGWLDHSQEIRALELARQVAELLKLKLEVAEEWDGSFGPAEQSRSEQG